MASLYSIVLAEGAFGTSEASLYKPASSIHATNVCLIIDSPGASDRVVTILIKKSGGTSRVIDKVTLSQDWKRTLDGIHLGPSDDLRGLQDSGTDCTFIVMGGTDA